MPKEFNGKRNVHVYYHIERFDKNSWWSTKEKRWGNPDEDSPDYIKAPFKSWKEAKTKKSATRMMMGLPKGSVMTKVFWKHGQRFMIDYYRS